MSEEYIYTTADITRAVNLSYIQLKKLLFEKGVVSSLTGEMTLNDDYKDWGKPTFNQFMKKIIFMWNDKGRNEIIKIVGINSNESTKKKNQSTFSNMQLQQTFKTKYADSLLDCAKNGSSISLYAQDIFPIEKENILYIPSIRHPEGLIDKMIPSIEYDFESAVALYEAYQDLSPLQAADKSFWVYLAHTELFSYVQQRFNSVLDPDFNNSQYVLDHWFFAHGPLRHALAGLWWAVFLSFDENADGEERYKYTKFLFSRDINLRTIYLANYPLFRHKEAAIGILRFLMEDEELCSVFFRQRTRYISKYFNKLGGTRQLVSLDRNFFYTELKKIRPQIIAIQSEEDLKNSI